MARKLLQASNGEAYGATNKSLLIAATSLRRPRTAFNSLPFVHVAHSTRRRR
jgi:hypothetical protein